MGFKGWGVAGLGFWVQRSEVLAFNLSGVSGLRFWGLRAWAF